MSIYTTNVRYSIYSGTNHIDVSKEHNLVVLGQGQDTDQIEMTAEEAEEVIKAMQRCIKGIREEENA